MVVDCGFSGGNGGDGEKVVLVVINKNDQGSSNN